MKERIAQAQSSQSGELLHDPIEDDPAIVAVLEEVDQEIKTLLMGVAPEMSHGHVTWKYKKAILKRKHDILWFSPAEMNPDTKFD